MIGGALDYKRLAELHRPTDPDLIAAEVHRMSKVGYSPIDISTALRLNLAIVRNLLRATPEEAAAACKEAWKR